MARQEYLNRLGGEILDAAVTVHKAFGPGLLESAYEHALLRELQLRELDVKRQIPVNLHYKGAVLEKGFVVDLMVEDEIILEIKAVDVMHSVYYAQLITYLKLTDKKLGYLINFNVMLLKDGFKRVVYNF